jgi:hypothetical protein
MKSRRTIRIATATPLQGTPQATEGSASPRRAARAITFGFVLAVGAAAASCTQPVGSPTTPISGSPPIGQPSQAAPSNIESSPVTPSSSPVTPSY